MRIVMSVSALREVRALWGSESVGLVPTMGYLHEGHLSLVERAAVENDRTVVSVYVNPTQFAPNEDLERYPRNLERDYALLAPFNVDAVFVPDNGEMYPQGFQTTVSVAEVTRYLEGERRPSHFAGVTTVVAKLFNIVQPARAYFGQKDVQQTVVIARMVRDLNFPLELVVCPTVREADGLAMSSRNKYLSPAERSAAPVLFRALSLAERQRKKGEMDAESLCQQVRGLIESEPLASIDYISVADGETLQEIEGALPAARPALISLAVYFGETRLIDNVLI